ncbi:uncharacterized protein LOC131300231 [Rhododendron vialii]|uniref:uncharacterized protein LOC131300231 n=1 Tax=Rhododendron vialii TaxID=182163 RepID=UPI00265E29B6|nr:uncharacterized protein LOC131300231 [Rhododendron vialii]
MFKSAKRGSEKSKIKAVFQLQFEATQVPQVKAKALTISLVPADVGKPTVRLEKAVIVDGTCFWENPVYETVKLIRDPKTRGFIEKKYHFIVSSGSSKAGLLGEVSINFANYAEAATPSTVSLPLKASNHGGTGAILHVTIHNMQESVDLRESEAGENPTSKSQDRSPKNQLRNNDRNENSNLSFTENECINKLSSENSENIRTFRDFLEEDPIIQQGDTTFRQDSEPKKRTSDALPKDGYRHQNSENNRNFKDFLEEAPMILQGDTTFRQDSVPKKRTSDTLPKNGDRYQRLNRDCSTGSTSDGSMVDLANSSEENILSDRTPETSHRTVEKLMRKISMLERQAELSELELQTVRKQIVKERKRGQELSRKISSLREERNAIGTDYEQLKSREVSYHLQIETEELKDKLEEMGLELNHEKDLGVTLRVQLQKTEDSNFELVHAIKELNEILEQKDREIADLSTKIRAGENDKEDPKEVPVCTDVAEEVDMLEQEIEDLNGELEVYRKDKEELAMHMDQLATEYDILKQENHNFSLKLQQHKIEKVKMQNEFSELSATIKEFELQMERLEKEIKEQALELTESSEINNKLQSQVESLETKLEKQAQGFEDDLEGITLLKIEQEQRAIRAEEALRKTKSNNAVAAERVQERFQRLSVEMSSKIDENEKAAVKAVAEANDLRMKKRVVEEILQKATEELGLMKEQYEEKLQELSNQRDMKAKQIEQMSRELEEKDIKIENFEKQEESRKLKAKIERLKTRNNFSAEAHPEEKWRNKSDGVKKEAQKLQEELNTLRSSKDEKDTMVKTLQSDIEKLTVQYNELKHSLSEVEQEKENLRKVVFKLEGDLQKKEEAISATAKKLQSNGEQARNRDTKQLSSKRGKSAKDVARGKIDFVELPWKGSTAGAHKENGDSKTPVRRDVEALSEMNISSFPPSDDNYLTQLLGEMELLKERNKSMEGELKEMQERYSEVSLKFAEVEGERQQLVMTVRNLKNTKK